MGLSTLGPWDSENNFESPFQSPVVGMEGDWWWGWELGRVVCGGVVWFGYSITSLLVSFFLSFYLYIDVKKLGGGDGGGGWVELDYSVSSGPFLTMNFEFDHDHGPRPGP